MKRLFGLIILIAVAILYFACGRDNSLEKLRENELKLLDEYIRKNHEGAVPRPSGLYYFVNDGEEGLVEDTIKVGDRIQVFYATWTIDSSLVDQSNGYTLGHRYEPLEFIVGASEVIGGLDEAATLMHPGTKAHLVIPSELAYGQNGSGTIGGFTTLLMEVEVYKVYHANIPQN